MCAGRILAAGAGGFYRSDRDQRASAGGRAGAGSVDPRRGAVFRWPALWPQLPETGVSARGSVDPARIRRQLGERLSAKPAGAADSSHLVGQPDHQRRRRDQGRANPPQARRGGQADARFAARHFRSSPVDRVALRARPCRGKYRPQDQAHWVVERRRRATPPPTTSVSRRYGALALPLAPAWIWSAYAALFPGQELLGTTLYWLFWAG